MIKTENLDTELECYFSQPLIRISNRLHFVSKRIVGKNWDRQSFFAIPPPLVQSKSAPLISVPLFKVFIRST